MSRNSLNFFSGRVAEKKRWLSTVVQGYSTPSKSFNPFFALVAKKRCEWRQPEGRLTKSLIFEVHSVWKSPLKSRTELTYFKLNNSKVSILVCNINKWFENHPKCRIWIFEFWHFPPIFVLLKLTCLVRLFDSKLQVFKNSPKLSIFGIFN